MRHTIVIALCQQASINDRFYSLVSVTLNNVSGFITVYIN